MNKYKRMKTRLLFTVTILIILSGCGNRTSDDDNGKNTYNSDVLPTDIITFRDDEKIIHVDMKYFDFDKIGNLTHFFDSISTKHPLQLWSAAVEDDDTNERIKKCIARIDSYRKGENRWFPDSLVSDCIRLISFNAAIINNHGPEYTDLVYGEWFMMCAAYYSPDITCLVNTQTPDHRAGFYNYGGSYNDGPWWTYLFLKREKGYEVACLGDFVAVRSIFLLKDELHRKYYLCSNNRTSFEFNQWLYWVTDNDSIIRVAECHTAPHPDDTGTVHYFFDQNRLIWKCARKDYASGRLVAISDEPALTLVLDGKSSYFN